MKIWRLSALAEVALQQAIESLAVAGFILAHFVHGIMHGIVTQLLGALGNGQLAVAGAKLGISSHGHVLLRAVGQHFSQKLCKLGGVLGFFPCVTAESLGYFRISFATISRASAAR